MSGLIPSRGMRWLLVAFACVAAIALFLLATATANTDFFARRYDLLLVLNGALVVLLMLLVGLQLWRLYRNLRAGVFGSRLAVRLVLLFALVAVLPGALVYAVSVQFLGRSIESWFDVRVDRALEGGLNLGRNAVDYLLRETSNKASQLALTLEEAGPGAAAAARLPRAAEQAGVYEAALYSGVRCDSLGRRRRRRDGASGASVGAGAAARAVAADDVRIRAGRRRRSRATRRRSGQQRRPAGAAQGAAGRRSRAEIARAGSGEGPGRCARLSGNLVHARLAEAPLCDHAHADAAARAHVGAGACRGALRAFRGAARAARRRNARGRAGRFHAAPAGHLEGRAWRAHRVVQHDDGAARRSAAEDRGVAPRDRDDARLSREHPRQSFRRRARVRRPVPAAHGQCERGGHPAAAARRPRGADHCRVGRPRAGAETVRRCHRQRISSRAGTAGGRSRRSSGSRA